MKKVKILIVEDEEETLNIMSQRISEQGYHVVSAHNGEQALEMFRKEMPDLIVLDLVLPKIDGLEVLRTLRENYAVDSWKPVIIVTARPDIEHFSEDFFTMTDYYIHKPCYMEDILRAIRFMLDVMDQGSEFGGFARS